MEVESLSDIIGQPVSNVESVVSKEEPVLLYGPPGTGKTTTAKLIGDRVGDDVRFFNVPKTGWVEDVYNNIEPVVDNEPLNGGKRCVILDEIEFMSDSAQARMRHILDNSRCMWIATTNDRSELTEALCSRFVPFEFGYLSDDKIEELVRPYTDNPRKYIKEADGDARRATKLLKRDQLIDPS